MASARKRKKARKRTKTFLSCLREFVTPSVWKQAQTARNQCRKSPRWRTHPLIFVLLTMTWACGDSAAERFETARGFYVVCEPQRRRPGKTVEGFQKALSRLPVAALRAFAAAVRQRIAAVFADRWFVGGFAPLGCDGSRLECPRTAELEGRLGQAGKADSAPNLWVTALVHLSLGIPWAWRFGKGTASERDHLVHLLKTLPRFALVVCDAGYTGFALACAIFQAGADFLIRASSHVSLYREEEAMVPLEEFEEGIFFYWPEAVQEARGRPLQVRLIRVRDAKQKHDVWLLTSVFSPERLSVAAASKFYRWRWENEGFFRTYKRTLHKVKLCSRTVRMVHREAEGSLLAVQLLLAQGTRAMPACKPSDEAPKCSPRRVLLEIRRELKGPLGPRPRTSFAERLRDARRECRTRTSAKAIRPWPGRNDHTPPKPPRLLTLSDRHNALLERVLHAK